ncbi:hypothetical protein A374_06581 [Fictibacillus macauensis ZFHKF-1]|uniref:DUF402 domain-containing protein n=1 Tax=Fictibacillus macauensis ZFHKF-1 TaxID=1196324 RepID=I8AKX1_9BACL|nr:DUF402 domain-containing protein [Fictibacillus macauensis]EIT86244.1 hypothetical protein A374_06581 [Fictibacillus macauensis ZFHKF-1]
MLQRKYSDRRNWARLLKRTYTQHTLQSSNFTGHLSFLYIEKVSEPAYRTYDSISHCIASNQYTWLQHFPSHQHYTMTTMFNEKGEVVQHYIDIARAHGMTSDHRLYWDDLYLDLVLLPDGSCFLLDEDELEEARTQGLRFEDVSLARETASSLIAAIERRDFLLPSLAHEHYTYLKKL